MDLGEWLRDDCPISPVTIQLSAHRDKRTVPCRRGNNSRVHAPSLTTRHPSRKSVTSHLRPASCGCNSCGTQSCSTAAPHGYAIQPNCGWNTYGIDPQEFLCDGGDHDANAPLRKDDSIAGLDAEDTIVHYTTEAGDIEIAASNRVCVYAPRFGSVAE